MRASGPVFQCQRKFPRTSAFNAGLLVRDDHSEPLNCLIRNISRDGAQIRASAAQPVPDRGYMVNLKTRCVYQTRAVWRRGSLTGLDLIQTYAIDDSLPAHLEFLRSLFVEAKLHQADQLITEGIPRAAALRKCGIAEKRNRRSSDIFSV